MSSQILKSVSHLYRIFKVYLTIALLGASAVIAYGLLISKPMFILSTFIGLSALLTMILIWFQTKTLSFGRNSVDKEPPKLPESVMAVILPVDKRELIIGDLNEEFSHLERKYGRRSAATWYAIQSMRVVLHISVTYITFNRTKRVAEDVVEK
jgi:hypothetical protein